MAAPPVRAQGAGLAPGAYDGGQVGKLGNALMGANHAVGLRKEQKRPGAGVLVPCSACGRDNHTEMIMGNRAQFTCGNCGAVVLWRPRQVWLRDQGRPMEMPIHPKPGEADTEGCKCVVM
eukprot:TRINITY_DN305_c0_g2_i2.p3 TRINITY_DN305_c0_g2~~TRINITY_DN305_c0_g2_i2.p3  ORF type:complete len:120 (+),score=23.33 TRINITY_DN305_c0_g2_i2:51-410(+)